MCTYLSSTQEIRENEDYETHHFIGVDNLHHHVVIYSHILKNLNLPLMDKLYIRKWFLANSEKQSSSNLNFLNFLDYYNKGHLTLLDLDIFRTYIIANDTLIEESNLSYEDFITFHKFFVNKVNNLYRRVFKGILKKTISLCTFVKIEFCVDYCKNHEISNLK